MKIISWNINGIRAVFKKGFKDSIKELKPDVLLLQEIKADNSITKNGDFKLTGYESFYHPAYKKGYSGVAIYTKVKPLSIIYGIGDKQFDLEGRMIAIEMADLYVVNIYLPHSGRKTEKLDKKNIFNLKFYQFIKKLALKKPVIIGGDFNVAHCEIDLARPKDNTKNAGFTTIERQFFTKLLGMGYIDTFRLFNKNPGNYTWWTYRFKARERNVGWRVDYLLIDKKIKHKLKKALIHPQTMGSDHCPVSIEVTN